MIMTSPPPAAITIIAQSGKLSSSVVGIAVVEGVGVGGAGVSVSKIVQTVATSNIHTVLCDINNGYT